MDGDNNNPKPNGNNNDQGNSSMASDFAKESNLAPNQGGAKPQMSERMKGGVKNAAVNSSETAQKVKGAVDDAKRIADPTVSSNQMAKEEIQNAQGLGEKADAAVRVAAGKGASAAAGLASGGATKAAPGLNNAIEKGGMVLARPENRKKTAIGVVALILLPLAAFFLILGVAAANPLKFVGEVLSDPKGREFAVQAAAMVPKALVSSEDSLKKYGYVEYKPGTALAQTTSQAPAPPPGSLEEKILKINLKNAKYQTQAIPNCPYKFTYKDLVGPGGKTTSVVDKVYNEKGEEVSGRGFVYGYCLVQTMPLFNMMVRTENAREINKYSNTVLNYADSNNSPNLKNKSKQEANEYVYDKTVDRITSRPDSTPKVDGYASLSQKPEDGGIEKYINDVRKAIDERKDPDAIEFPIKNTDDAETKAQTMCAFSDGYLTQENIKKAIGSRLNTGQRSGVKINTMSSTRELGFVSNAENEATFKQSDGWTSSTAYSQNLYGTLAGEQINPENLGNSAYGADYTDTISLLLGLKVNCDGLKSSQSIFGKFKSFFGFGQSEDEATQGVLNVYTNLQDLIIRDSNGKFTNRDSFGMEQLIIGVVRMGGGAAVSGVENSPQSFNNQSQGFRAISNQYIMRMGGRFLSKEESTKLNLVTENTRIEVEKRNGIGYRLFAKDNVRSIANIIQYEIPRTPNELKNKSKQYIATISNPVRLIADTQNTLGYIANGTRNVAFAAGEVGDSYMKLNTVGIPESALEGVDVVAVSNEIQKIQKDGTEQEKAVLSYFDKCSKSNIPTANYFIRGYDLNNDGSINKNAVLKIEEDELNLPIYPAAGEGNGGQANFKELGFENRKELVACELYLLPNRQETTRDLGAEIQKGLFGIQITELARKYHIYLYANSIADLMVELSSTEKTDKIYANSTGGETEATEGSTNGIVGDIGLNSDSVPCPSGTTDKGVADSKYTGARKKESGVLKIRLCQIPDIPGNGADASGNIVSGGAIVNSRVAGAWAALAKAAKAEGVNLRSNSSFRLFDSCGGSGDGSACARPGQSPHQLGIAIDFQDMGLKAGSTTSCSNRARLPNSPQWSWMFKNAEKWGIEQYSFEAWHWDLLGGGNRCNSSE